MRKLNCVYRGIFIAFIATCIVIWGGCFSARECIKGLRSKNINHQRQAAYQIQRIGSKGRRAVPELMNIAAHHENAELRRLAIEAIGSVGRRAWKANIVLTNALQDEDVHVRRAAVVALGKLEKYPATAFPNLIACLGDSDTLVRELTMSSFEELGPHAIGTLIRALNNEDADVRRSAAITIGRLGSEACSASRALKRACNDENVEVVRKARQALKRVSGDNSRLE